MRLLNHITGSLKSSVEGLFAPAADPRQSFATFYERQRELQRRTREALGNVAASKDRLRAKADQVREKLPLFEDEARQMLAAGRESLARLSLRRRQMAATELEILENRIGELWHEEQRLATIEEQLSVRIAASLAQREVIEAQYTAAEAEVRIGEALTGISEEIGRAGLELEEAELRTERMRARAAAIDSLVDVGVL